MFFVWTKIRNNYDIKLITANEILQYGCRHVNEKRYIDSCSIASFNNYFVLHVFTQGCSRSRRFRC